ncbi:hypothetical protein Adi01nite_20460 [Amorphoplanes digitatis]|nr:hypothetical protein Adi01nite_20460 [Actinoplanes digitatis]
MRRRVGSASTEIASTVTGIARLCHCGYITVKAYTSPGKGRAAALPEEDGRAKELTVSAR